MHIRPIHPFPARMAPDLALDSLAKLKQGSIVLDPMVGSGTVLRQAVGLGHQAIGFDMDPLAVLMTRVWTTGVARSDIQRELQLLIQEARNVDLRTDKLPWVSADIETKEFIAYWFGSIQRRDLQRLAFVLHLRRQARLGEKRRAAVDVLAVALSRIIITKDQGASLARDASHSRPHKVAEDSNYDVFSSFERSAGLVCDRVLENVPGTATVRLGDARQIPIQPSSVDAVLTSPPYLNAIDYMRGHRLSLVWLGYQLRSLRAIRSTSIGSERGIEDSSRNVNRVSAAIFAGDELPDRFNSMIQRYAHDLLSMTSEVARVLKKGGVATFVIGNSCIKNCFVRNSDGLLLAGRLSGLTPVGIKERELPAGSRYLPITSAGALSKRMRTETVLTFSK